MIRLSKYIFLSGGRHADRFHSLARRGFDATPEQLRTYIANLHGFAGINGLYDFRDGSQRGLTASTAIILSWDAARGQWSGVSRPGGAPIK